MATYFEEFEFDLPEALIDALVALLGKMPAAALTEENVARIGNVQGVYQIFLDGELVYIGKTDADAGLYARLKRHSRKILGRVGLDTSRITFKAVRIYVFTAMDLEQLLIARYGLNSNNSWNHSGFGSNDPGRERDTTRLKPHHFDKKYPVDYSCEVILGSENGDISVDEALRQLRLTTPYTFRFEAGARKSRHPDLLAATVKVLADVPESLISVLSRIKAALGGDWQITMLPGYVIGYKESKSYPEGIVVTESLSG